jgi:WD40 repeat protein
MIRLWDVETGNPSETIARHPDASFADLAFSQDGEILVSRSWEGEVSAVRVWDLTTGGLLHFFPTETRAIALSSDGGTIVSAGWDIRVWRIP